LMPALETVLANRFKVVHTTLQCETKPCAHQPEACTTVSGTSEHDDKPNFH
jgi:cobalt-zinc-cadmium efflux system protein